MRCGRKAFLQCFPMKGKCLPVFKNEQHFVITIIKWFGNILYPVSYN